MLAWSEGINCCSYGMKIFPLGENQKIPAISKNHGGNGCLDATDNEETIAEWMSIFPTGNYGIACGLASNLVVIDIDVKNGAAGEKTVADFERQGRIFPKTAEVITPTGGRHLYYKYHEKVSRNSAGKLGLGIDVRSCGGYVVGPESRINGQKYFWNRHPSYGIAPLPLWLVICLNPTPRPSTYKPRNINRNDKTVEEVMKALERISNHDYDTWISTGMALKAEFGDSGYNMWLNWSAIGYANFSEGECLKKWRSFNKSGIGIRSLFYNSINQK